MRKKISRFFQEMIFLGPVNVVCDIEIRKLCLSPYFNHPKGCPNYGKKESCPPYAGFFPDFYEEKVYIVAAVLNFEKYLDSRKNLHPDWTERALRNPRHWQNHLRSALRKFALEKFGDDNNGDVIIFNPEAMGVNVTQICENTGLTLEWPPQKRVCQVALIVTMK